MFHRLNISLPEKTIRMIDGVIKDGELSEERVGESPAETLCPIGHAALTRSRSFHQQSRAILYQAKN
jgi:hypothetical protein